MERVEDLTLLSPMKRQASSAGADMSHYPPAKSELDDDASASAVATVCVGASLSQAHVLFTTLNDFIQPGAGHGESSASHNVHNSLYGGREILNPYFRRGVQVLTLGSKWGPEPLRVQGVTWILGSRELGFCENPSPKKTHIQYQNYQKAKT
jgi:hypothetical protein